MLQRLAILLLAGTLVLTGAEIPSPRAGSLYLTNGDVFSGEFVVFDPKQGLQWRHPAAKTPWLVAVESLAKIELHPVATPKELRRHNTHVRLVNGDVLAGDVIELDAAQLTLDTWYAGRLNLPRAALRDVSFSAHGRAVLDGAAAFTGWGGGVMGVQLGQDGEEIGGVLVNSLVANGPAEGAGVKAGDVITAIDGKKFLKRDELIADVKSREPGRKVVVAFRRGEEKLERAITLAAIGWQVKEGELVSSGDAGVLARNIDFPDAANIEFDLDWRGLPSMAIAFCTDNPAAFSLGNAYTFNFNSGYAYLGRHEKNGDGYTTTTLDPPVPLPLAAAAGPAHLSIRFDKRTKTIALLLDDALVKQWQDPQGFAGKGRGLSFSTAAGSQLRITNLRVSEWDGQLPAQLGVAAGDAREDSVRLMNRDTLSGGVTGVRAGKVTVKAAFGEVQIPLERIGRIEFATPKPAPANASGLATGFLSGRNRLTFQLQSWRDGEAHITSPLFGSVRFSTAAFTALEFGGK
ncbi:MAG: PDZ domain-containing protein [Pedosphaera sp.]|nr:PDZ domain-containing protein [Pedosphaera sp.]MST00669.1 PDZ domain-containing protein [Pedosphaera sp.]